MTSTTPPGEQASDLAAEPARGRSRQALGFRALLLLVPVLFDWYLRFVDWTSKKVVIREEHDGFTQRGEPTAFVTFHQGLIYFVQHFRRHNGVVMASRSRDGDVIAAVLRRLGYHAARGSSSRGGKAALAEMIEAIRDGASGGLVCDGPRGPFGVAKIGIVLLARESGRPLVPCACWMTRKRLLNGWDRSLVPLPFSRIFVAYGTPIRVAPDASREACEAIRQDLEARVLELSFEVQEAAGEPRQDFRSATA